MIPSLTPARTHSKLDEVYLQGWRFHNLNKQHVRFDHVYLKKNSSY